MKADADEFRMRLEGAMELIGLDADVAKISNMLQYLGLLQRWNRTYNLTALRDPESMLVQHVFDSLSIVPLLRRRPGISSIADVGSGAGLPGIILGICEPRWHIWCIDAVEKKTAFMRHACGVLGLQNIKVVHARVETMAALEVDVVISRAFASLKDFAVLAGHHASSTGELFAMKGRDPVEEIRQLESATDWRVAALHELSVPGLTDGFTSEEAALGGATETAAQAPRARRCLVRLVRNGLDAS